MNRALRRQQTKQPKGAKGGGQRAGARAIPRSGTAAPQARPARRGGIFSWRPRFVMDIISELRKVVWPTRDDVVHLTIVVVIVTVILGAILGGIDFGFSWLIDRTLLR